MALESLHEHESAVEVIRLFAFDRCAPGWRILMNFARTYQPEQLMKEWQLVCRPSSPYAIQEKPTEKGR